MGDVPRVISYGTTRECLLSPASSSLMTAWTNQGPRASAKLPNQRTGNQQSRGPVPVYSLSSEAMLVARPDQVKTTALTRKEGRGRCMEEERRMQWNGHES